MNLLQQLTKELQDSTNFIQGLHAQLAASQKREQALCQLVRDCRQLLINDTWKGESYYARLESVEQRAKELLGEVPVANVEEIADTALQLLATLPESYPPSELSRDPEGLYSLTVGDTLIFHSKPATDALARVTRYVKERDNSPTLPVGVIDGIYD